MAVNVTLWFGMWLMGRLCMYGARECMETVLSAQFCCEPKTALKINFID